MFWSPDEVFDLISSRDQLMEERREEGSRRRRRRRRELNHCQ